MEDSAAVGRLEGGEEGVPAGGGEGEVAELRLLGIPHVGSGGGVGHLDALPTRLGVAALGPLLVHISPQCSAQTGLGLSVSVGFHAKPIEHLKMRFHVLGVVTEQGARVLFHVHDVE